MQEFAARGEAEARPVGMHRVAHHQRHGLADDDPGDERAIVATYPGERHGYQERRDLAQHQQAMEQLQQLLQQTPPELSTVTVAQDTSENHQIHAQITLGMLTSPTGRKLKNGNEDQQKVWQNLKLHWQEHMDMAQKLSPPKEMEFKGNVSIDPSKFPPQAQAQMFEAMGLEVPPHSLEPEQQTHEITQEQEGMDANGIPTKTKVSVSGAPLK